MWSSLMKNAPANERRASQVAGVFEPSSSCSNGCFLEKARSAARFTAASLAFETGFNFVEESSGNASGPTAGVVEGNGDAIGDCTLKGCQIRDNCVKSKRAEVFAKIGQVGLVVQPGLLVTRGQVAEQ